MEIIKHDAVDAHLLRIPSITVEENEDVSELALQLLKILKRSKNGVAIAAPQIGVHKRVVVMDFMQYKSMVMINPVIIHGVGTIKMEEGCLSFPNLFIRKKRKQHVRVRYMTLSGVERELDFFAQAAVCVQHEIDHLDGKLLTDEPEGHLGISINFESKDEGHVDAP